MSDPRYGVPSASCASRVDNCPPSFELGKRFENGETRDSKSGDAVHKALEHWGEHGAIDGLDHDQIQTAEMCIDQRNEALNNWIGDGHYEVFVERRLGLTPLGKVVDCKEKSPVRIVFSGMADFTAISGTEGFVADYKTLRGDHDEASENAQLRSLAVLLAKRHNLTAVRVVLIQPWKGKPTTADFDAEALRLAQAWLLGMLDRERNSTPDQANPGKWCHFCPAKVSCKAFREPVLAVVSQATMTIPTGDNERSRAALFAKAANLSDDQLAACYRGLEMIKWYVVAVDGATRIRAEEGGEFAQSHFKIVETKPKETITAVDSVWSKLAAIGVSAEDFTAACKTTKKAVALLTRKATGLKGKGLGAKIAEVLNGAVTLGKPSKRIVAANETNHEIEDWEDEE